MPNCWNRVLNIHLDPHKKDSCVNTLTAVNEWATGHNRITCRRRVEILLTPFTQCAFWPRLGTWNSYRKLFVDDFGTPEGDFTCIPCVG